MADSPSFKSLKDQYFLLDRNFNKLFAACTNAAQQDELRRDYVNSRDNFWEARNRIFSENDPQVKKLTKELSDSTDTINGMLQNLQNITKILNTITGAVRLGSSLVTMGSGSA
jgi:methyl-accepting chemotaxis protein